MKQSEENNILWIAPTKHSAANGLQQLFVQFEGQLIDHGGGRDVDHESARPSIKQKLDNERFSFK